MNLNSTAKNFVETSSLDVAQIDPVVVNYHADASLEDNRASLGELTAEMSKGLLQGEKYEQEKAFLEMLVQEKQ